MPEITDNNEIQRRYATLTSREVEVARLLVQTTSARDVAATLGVSVMTVLAHTQGLKLKMGVQSTADLVQMLRDQIPPLRS